MKRLIRTLLVSFIVLALLCVAAIFSGRSQPVLAILPELKPCGGSLCYLGIVLGKTPLDEGTKLIRDNPQLKSYPTVFSLSSAEGSPALVFNEVQLYFPNTPFPLGNVINLFGSPCYVKSFGNAMDVGYPNAVFHVPTSTFSLMPSSAVVYIDVRASTEQPCAQSNSDGTVYDWRGFRDYH